MDLLMPNRISKWVCVKPLLVGTYEKMG